MGCEFYTSSEYPILRIVNIYDPVCGADIAAIVSVFLFGFLNLVLCTLAFIYRNWTPMKSKQPAILIIGMVFGFLWTFASLFINKNMDAVLSPAWNEYAWALRYFGQVLMFAAWISTLLVRMCRLYIIFVAKRKPISMVALFFVFLLPSIAVAIGGILTKSVRQCATIVVNDNQLYQDANMLTFNISIPRSSITNIIETNCLCMDWRYIITAMFGFYFIIFFTFCILLRNVRSSFNEYHETRIEGILGAIAFTITVILVNTGTGYECWSRFGQTAIITVLYSLILWLALGPTVYNRIWRLDEAEEDFYKNLGVDSKNFISANTPTPDDERWSPRET